MSSTVDLETQYRAHNYHPLPVVLTRGEGVKPDALILGKALGGGILFALESLNA